jgi:hypothetical protein
MSNQDNIKGTMVPEPQMLDENKFAYLTIDQLLSAYAIAYKAGDIETFKENRAEILRRVRAFSEAKRLIRDIVV